MLQRRVRDYQVSLWSLQDSFLATLKHYGLEFKGQIQQPKLTDRDDGTQEFSFSIPMYLVRDGKRIENPTWYTVQDGALLVSMRKIKVIFNKDAEKEDRKIYQFLITKVTERHENGQLFCDVESEGLAFHELGKIGYKISLSADDFYNNDYDWYTTGKWTDSLGEEQTDQPLATLNYWNDRVFSTVNNWKYEIKMDWNSYSLYNTTVEDEPYDDDPMNDIKTEIHVRKSDRVYEDDYVDSWKYDATLNRMVPSHITAAREKTRVSLDVHESNIYNITQTLAETFGVFCKYQYEYDDNFHICGRKVVYYNNFLNEQYGAIDLTYPYDTASITREIDSTDLVTKLFVRPVDNTASAAGQTNIMDVGANKSKEDYILNFDYLHTIGGITDEQYELVEEYNLNMRRLNDKITPLSAKLISLQSQLTKLEAQKTTYTNSIIQDTQQLGQANELLNSVTQGTGLLSLTKEKPQTAVLLQNTSANNKSYYIKITQKGVYAETIQIYKSYNYTTCQLDNEVKTGQVEYDEFGNVIRVSNIFIGENDPKTVYVIYDYQPSLYYERIQAIWQTRLAEDEANLRKVEQQLAEFKYRIYGEEPTDETLLNYIDALQLIDDDININKQFQDLLNEKNTAIKVFNSNMGAALREGYWQPDDYTDYGDRYTDTLQVGEQQYIGSTGNAMFKWDDKLFEDEQDFTYQYTAAQNTIAYPCIPLNADILNLIQSHPDDVVSFIFKPKTSAEKFPQPKSITLLTRETSENVFLIPGLYEYQEETNEQNIKIKNWLLKNETYGSSAERIYPQQLNFSVAAGYAGYSKKYTYFEWQAKKPDSQDWLQITNYKKQENETQPYTFFVNKEYEKYIKFDLEEDIDITNLPDGGTPWKIKLYSKATNDNDAIDFDGWEFRLIVHNNIGTNISEDGQHWNNDLATYKIHLIPKLEFANAHNQSVAFTKTNEFKLSTTITRKNIDNFLPIKNQYTIQYFRTDDSSYSFNSWNNNTEIISNSSWTQLTSNSFNNVNVNLNLTNNGDTQTLQLIINTEDESLIELITKSGNTEQKEWRIRFKLIDETDSIITSKVYRLYYVDYTPSLEDIIAEDNSIIYPSGGEAGISDQLKYGIQYSIYKIEQHPMASIEWFIGSDKVATYEQKNNNWVWTYSSSWSNYISCSFDENNQFKPILQCKTAVFDPNFSYYSTTYSKLNGKLVKIIVKNDQITSLQYVFNDKPIIITGALQAEWDGNNSSTIVISPTTLTTVQYKINTLYASSFIWTINNSITLTINKTTISQTNNWYTATLITDTNNQIIGSKLQVNIPSINDNNPLRDNGTIIQCSCKNAAESQTKILNTTMQVVYPINIIQPDPFQSNTPTIKPFWYFNPVIIPLEVQISRLTNNSISTEFDDDITLQLQLYGPYYEDNDSNVYQTLNDNDKIDNNDIIIFSPQNWNLTINENQSPKKIKGKINLVLTLPSREDPRQKAQYNISIDNQDINIFSESNNKYFYYVGKVKLSYKGYTQIKDYKFKIQHTGPQVGNSNPTSIIAHLMDEYNDQSDTKKYWLSAKECFNISQEQENSIQSYNWFWRRTSSDKNVCQQEKYNNIQQKTTWEIRTNTYTPGLFNGDSTEATGLKNHLRITLQNPYGNTIQSNYLDVSKE